MARDTDQVRLSLRKRKSVRWSEQAPSIGLSPATRRKARRPPRQGGVTLPRRHENSDRRATASTHHCRRGTDLRASVDDLGWSIGNMLIDSPDALALRHVSRHPGNGPTGERRVGVAAALFDMLSEEAERHSARIPRCIRRRLVDRVLNGVEGSWIDGDHAQIRVLEVVGVLLQRDKQPPTISGEGFTIEGFVRLLTVCGVDLVRPWTEQRRRHPECPGCR